jgi:pyridoxal phosphate enzyme (YggS family)
MSIQAVIAGNLQRIRETISSAAARSGRAAERVTLVAVTKYAQAEWVQAMYELGQRDFGESRPQQLAERSGELPGDVRWHLIGTLQRNKVRPVLETGALIHSVDSVRLLERIDLIAAERGQTARVLLEVNLTGEETKHGFAAAELCAWAGTVAELRHVDLAGLMTMAAESDDPETARPTFVQLRELRDELRALGGPFAELRELSMGMSGDFEVAVEEGATLVRIGSALFEGLGE